MSVTTRAFVRILQCDKRYFTLTASKLDKLEEVVCDILDVEKGQDELTRKYFYTIKDNNKELTFVSKNRADALCRLIIRTPLLYEPIRVTYNKMVEDRFKSPKDRSEEKREARYQRRLELIKKLNSI